MQGFGVPREHPELKELVVEASRALARLCFCACLTSQAASWNPTRGNSRRGQCST